MPLYRQENEWHNLGVNLSRATMSNWILASYRDWLSPIVELLKQKLLEQGYLHIDETPVQVLKEAGRKNTMDSYMWVYCSIKESQHPIRLFDYQPGRSRKYQEKILSGYNGYIHTDAYKGYKKVSGVTRCFCWLHLRRHFVDALPKGAEASARIYTLIETAKANGLNPRKYIQHILSDMPGTTFR